MLAVQATQGTLTVSLYKYMDSSDFGKITSETAKKLYDYFKVAGPKMVVRETLRFIDDNFRMQGWQGESFKPWAPIKRGGTILVKTGALKRGFIYENRGNGEVYFLNQMPYSGVHNSGFNGTVNVSAHRRSQYVKAKVYGITDCRKKSVTVKVGEHSVDGHTRKMNIVQRQFAPTSSSQSPVLNNAIIHCLEQDLYNIFNT